MNLMLHLTLLMLRKGGRLSLLQIGDILKHPAIRGRGTKCGKVALGTGLTGVDDSTGVCFYIPIHKVCYRNHRFLHPGAGEP